MNYCMAMGRNSAVPTGLHWLLELYTVSIYFTFIYPQNVSLSISISFTNQELIKFVNNYYMDSVSKKY